MVVGWGGLYRHSLLVCPPPHAELTPVASDPANPDEPFSLKNFIYGKLKKKRSSEAANYSGGDPSDSCALKKSVISILDVRVDSLLSRRRGGEEDRHGSG